MANETQKKVEMRWKLWFTFVYRALEYTMLPDPKYAILCVLPPPRTEAAGLYSHYIYAEPLILPLF